MLKTLQKLFSFNDFRKNRKWRIINIGTGKMHTMEQIANTIGGEVVFILKEI